MALIGTRKFLVHLRIVHKRRLLVAKQLLNSLGKPPVLKVGPDVFALPLIPLLETDLVVTDLEQLTDLPDVLAESRGSVEGDYTTGE